MGLDPCLKIVVSLVGICGISDSLDYASCTQRPLATFFAVVDGTGSDHGVEDSTAIAYVAHGLSLWFELEVVEGHVDVIATKPGASQERDWLGSRLFGQRLSSYLNGPRIGLVQVLL